MVISLLINEAAKHHYQLVELLNIATTQCSFIASYINWGMNTAYELEKKLNVPFLLGMSSCFILCAWYYMYYMPFYRTREAVTQSGINSQFSNVGTSKQACKNQPCECKLHQVAFLLISSVPSVVFHFCKLQKKAHYILQ